MFKKIAITALLAGAGLFVLNRAGLTSYGATAFHKLRTSFKNQVPLEFEIERLRYQVAELVPDMKKNLSDIAEEMVSVQNLKDEIQDTRVALKRQKENIMAMTKDLENGAMTISYGGHDYSAGRIREKLDRDFASFQRCESELQTKEKILEAKERSLDSRREELGSVRQQKQELEGEIARMEADLKAIRLAQTNNKFHYDDSGLAHCKATLADIQTRLRVEKQKVELEGQFANDNAIPVEKKAKSVNELTKEIKAYFHGPAANDAKVVERK